MPGARGERSSQRAEPLPPFGQSVAPLPVMTMEVVAEREIRVGDRLVDADGHLWRVVRVTPPSATLRGRETEAEYPLEDGLPAGDRDFAPVEVPESEWARLGLDAIGRLPAPGDLVSFPAEQKLLRVVAVGTDTLNLRVVEAAPGDESDLGTLIETSLRDYLDAWGEGTFTEP